MWLHFNGLQKEILGWYGQFIIHHRPPLMYRSNIKIKVIDIHICIYRYVHIERKWYMNIYIERERGGKVDYPPQKEKRGTPPLARRYEFMSSGWNYIGEERICNIGALIFSLWLNYHNVLILRNLDQSWFGSSQAGPKYPFNWAFYFFLSGEPTLL